VSAFYIYRLFDLETLKNSREAVVIFAVVIIAVMTTICVIGTELSARVQRVMVFAQVGAVVLLVVVGVTQLIFGGAPDTSITVSLSWLNPFDAPSYSALLSALLLGVFIYWGWESAVNLTEETEDGSHAAGLAGVVSVVVLLATYVGVAIVVLGIAGVDKLQRFDDNSNILGNIADDVLGPLSFLVALAIITSGIASTRTTILPASRTSLSMATQGAFPRIFARIHPRFLTPDF
jgi:amino acid transporter